MQNQNLHPYHSPNEGLNNPLSNPSKWATFKDKTKDAVRRTLLGSAMVAGLGSMPSGAMSALTDETRDQIATVVNSDDNQLDNEVMDYILEAKRSDISTINKVQEYSPMQISYLTPADILPIVGQIEAGDKKAYEHIEHLRIAEATKVRDMMWEYGAGDYDAKEYKEKMGRLNTGMMGESPKGFDNYEIVGGNLENEPREHGHDERDILNSLIKHANFKVIDTSSNRYDTMFTMCRGDTDKINIIGCSIGADLQTLPRNVEQLKEYDKENNRLIFGSGTNITSRKKICQENIDISDDQSTYSTISRAHGKKDAELDRHCLITVGTNKNGNVEYENNERDSGSKFPIGFHDQVLFAGRIFPYHSASNGKISADRGNYDTSYTNYVNVAMTDLCFQMRADVADVDELLDKMRATALTDYIRLDLNGDGDTDDVISMATDDGSIDQPESQPLQLINPAGFFNKYNLPDSLPSNVASNEAIPLEKGYYKGVIFNIPGAEVYINGEWIAVNNSNSSLIKSQNPFHLTQWRINGNLLRELGYNEGETITGTIQAVDDEWNGLKGLNKEFSVQLTAINGIDTLGDDDNSADDSWYSIDGKRLPDRPTTHGIYIHNGKKVVVK